MTLLVIRRIRIRPAASVFLFLLGCARAQGHFSALPRFEDYPVGEIFNGTPGAPKLVTPLEKLFADQIRDGVEKGWGVFREGKEQKGQTLRETWS